jgi:hypothetical protein
MNYLPQNKLQKWRIENEPQVCPLLNYKAKSWVVDHCHTNGQVRGVVSYDGNMFLGKIENAFKRCSKEAAKSELSHVLRNIADYLDKEDTKLIHPVGFRQLYKRFNSLNKDIQLDILFKLGGNRDEIAKCENTKQRTEIYKKLIKK